MAMLCGDRIQGERLHLPNLPLTRMWVREILPDKRNLACIQVPVQVLRTVLLSYLSKYPALSALYPHISCVYGVYYSTSQSLRLYRDVTHTIELMDHESLRGVIYHSIIHEFEDAELIEMGIKTQEAVIQYLTNQVNGEIHCVLKEQQFIINAL